MNPITPQQLERVQTALFNGNKIEAIKLHREATDSGLAESKQAVEAIEKDLRLQFPDKFAASSGKKGCSTLVLAVVILSSMGIGAFRWLLK